MTALDNNFNKHNNEKKESKLLNEAFNSGKDLTEFKKQMAQIEKNIDPRFLSMFKDYEARVSRLLSENLSVVASKVVQEELTRQNARVIGAFERNSIKLEDSYNKIFWGEDFSV